jgi:hypothetical protein
MREGRHPEVVRGVVVAEHAAPQAISEIEAIANPQRIALRHVDQNEDSKPVAGFVKELDAEASSRVPRKGAHAWHSDGHTAGGQDVPFDLSELVARR